jgi:hypothetical protein
MHDYHEELPGFHASQILHDGCAECEERGANVNLAISSLDVRNFARAWVRAAEWELHGLTTLSDAERPLLKVLWSVQLQFERRGLPIGEIPSALTL